MISEYANFFFFALGALFVIIDPLGNIPLFLAITQQNDFNERKRILKKAAFACCLILSFFLFTGNFILNLFHITIGAFKIAGGVVVFLISLQMLFVFRPGQKTSPREEQEALEKDDVAIFPLAIPFLSGPGAIATVMILRSKCQGLVHYGLTLSAIIGISLATYLLLKESQHLMAFFGQTGINIMTRLMGLILAVIAVQFIIDGIGAVLPGILQEISAQ